VRIVGVLLAAGAGARFGGGKLLAPLPSASHGAGAGTPIGVAAAMHLMAALNDAVVVVRPRDPLLSQALEGTGARVVVCDRADEGMGASLACGVREAGVADGYLIALADMPWIAPSSIGAVADALKSGVEIAAPSYQGERGHPVGFAKSYHSLLANASGDEGARSIVAARKWALHVIDVDDPGVVRDVDRPADLR
jgi:molybdenum cofactor cytidylyltransferase